MVRGRKKRKKQLWLSFDEWNVWYRHNTEADMNGQRKEAPHLVEEVYNLEDAWSWAGSSSPCCAIPIEFVWHALRNW